MLGCGLSFRGGAQLAVVRALPAVFFRGGPDKAGQAALVASMVELAALDLRPSLAAVSARTLVACGEKDKPYLADSREIAATIPGAQLRLIPGAGHLWPLQRVDDFVIGEATAERLRREGGTVVGIDWREHSVGVLSLEADLTVGRG